jgi:uncharacterized protein DUF6265
MGWSYPVTWYLISATGGVMIKSGTILLVLLICAGVGAAQEQKFSVSDLAWMGGCWEAKSKGREINEQWMKPAGQTMLGMGRTVAQGRTVEYEFMQIREDKDGAIYYIARPSGQSEASFKLIKLQNREAVFENLEHDFPQRVIYRLQSDGSLFARIEGLSRGQPRGIDYPMNRARCDN